MENYLLPVGTVVSLKESTCKVMIMGYCPVGEARPGYVWDYSGVAYPYGYVDGAHVFQFDHEQIEKVMAMGYQDVEQFNFIDKLRPALEDLKAEMDSKEHTNK